MCRRYGVADIRHFGERFQLYLDLDLSDVQPRYNAAPAQTLPVIAERDGERRLETMTWGLVPSWATDRTRPVINARAEGIQDKPTFRTPFRRQRCLVPATHFFEWQTTGKTKRPCLIRPADQTLFAFAGLYDVHYDPAGGDLFSFAVITTEPNAVTALIHNRMPVILRPDGERTLLEPATSALESQLLLGPYPAEAMEAHPVGPAVNSAQRRAGPDRPRIGAAVAIGAPPLGRGWPPGHAGVWASSPDARPRCTHPRPAPPAPARALYEAMWVGLGSYLGIAAWGICT